MTTIAEVREQTAKDLRDCADLIEKNGWTQGEFYKEVEGVEPPDCPVCSIGAIFTVVEGNPVGGGGEWASIQRAMAAKTAMYRQVDDNVIVWNDAPGRTAEEVISAFRACADEIESGEAFQ